MHNIQNKVGVVQETGCGWWTGKQEMNATQQQQCNNNNRSSTVLLNHSVSHCPTAGS